MAQLRRARQSGKVKNPAWYKAPRMPEGFKPDYRQHLPYDCKYGPGQRQSDTWLDIEAVHPRFKLPATDSVRKYVREFEKLKGLKHVKLVSA